MTDRPDLTPDVLRGWPLPQPGHGKYARGAVVVVGGSPGSPGAVLLSGLAALRVGAGKLSVAVAASRRGMPASTWRKMFSSMTIASSTTRPMASTTRPEITNAAPTLMRGISATSAQTGRGFEGALMGRAFASW